jgi:benzoyl-CoA reductase subunit C
MLFPSICDVIRNLSGVWGLLFPKKFVRYIDLPQNYESAIGGAFYRKLVFDLYRDLCALNDRKPDSEAVRSSIRLYNTNRDAMIALYAARAAEPWRYPSTEVYLVSRAGLRLPVEEHTALVTNYLRLAAERDARELDNARVVVRGAFCEQPPLELIRTLERAGCWLVDDDLLPILRWPPNGVSTQGDPFEALSEAWLQLADEASSRYAVDPHAKGRMLVQAVEKSGAEGVIFAAPSFCDPALLDRPMLQGACDRAHLAHTSFKYAENTGQMQPIREQAGTFADSIKLWGVA